MGDVAPLSFDLPAWTRFCERKGFKPIGRADLPEAAVYVAERMEPGKATADPIESQTHYVVAWALEQKVKDGTAMTFGRTVKLRAIENPFQNMRIKAALADAATHVRRQDGRIH